MENLGRCNTFGFLLLQISDLNSWIQTLFGLVINKEQIRRGAFLSWSIDGFRRGIVKGKFSIVKKEKSKHRRVSQCIERIVPRSLAIICLKTFSLSYLLLPRPCLKPPFAFPYPPTISSRAEPLVLLKTLILFKNRTEPFPRPLRLPVPKLLAPQLLLRKSLGIRIQPQQHLPVLERILLLHAGPLRLGAPFRGPHHGLHFRRVDQARQIGIGHDVGRQQEILLERRGRRRVAVECVERRERGRGPDDEAAQVSAGRELQEVEREDAARLDAGDVAEGLDELLPVGLRLVDDEGAAALLVPAPAQLALSRAQLARRGDFGEVGSGADGAEEGERFLGLDDGGLEGRGRDDEGDFGHAGDFVAPREEEGGNARGG